MGVKAQVLPPDTDCHHFVLEIKRRPYGSIFLAFPTVLDSSLAPEGRHILHIFTTSSIEGWEGLSTEDYEAKKKVVAYEIISRLEKKLFSGAQIINYFHGGQGVIAVAFSGVMCAHRVAADIGIEKRSPVMDAALLRLLGWLRTLA
ncbi:hypothetical protein D5086_013427 [Populus alba]|uniref:Uncharacterized protein n=1 Tax=Populus alba TaxID=43335 RepID=A0ACC4C5F2_POPAL